jgi:hypothetical protein
VTATSRPEFFFQVERPVDAVGSVIAEHVVRAGHDAGGAPGAQARSDYLVVEIRPFQLPPLGLTWFGYGHAA